MELCLIPAAIVWVLLMLAKARRKRRPITMVITRRK